MQPLFHPFRRAQNVSSNSTSRGEVRAGSAETQLSLGNGGHHDTVVSQHRLLQAKSDLCWPL